MTTILLKKIKSHSINLNEITEIAVGVQAYHHTLHTQEQIKSRCFHSKEKKDDTYIPIINGQDVKRYFLLDTSKEFLSIGDWLYYSPSQKFFDNPRILIQQVFNLKINATYTEDIFCNYNSIFNIIINDKNYSLKYILTIINSKLLSYIFPLASNKSVGKIFPKISITDINIFPIPKISFTTPKEERKKILENAIAIYEKRIKPMKESINTI